MSTETIPPTTSETKKMITLVSSDNVTFEIEDTVAMQSQTLKCQIEDECADNAIPLPNVTSAALVKVIEYCKKHAAPKEDSAEEGGKKAANKTNDDLKEWDKDYIDVDTDTLYDVIMATNYL